MSDVTDFIADLNKRYGIDQQQKAKVKQARGTSRKPKAEQETLGHWSTRTAHEWQCMLDNVKNDGRYYGSGFFGMRKNEMLDRIHQNYCMALLHDKQWHKG